MVALAVGVAVVLVVDGVLTSTALFLLGSHALDGRRNRCIRRAAAHQFWARLQASDRRENGCASHAVSRGHGARRLLGRADSGHAHAVGAVRGRRVVVSVGSSGGGERRVVARHGGGSSTMSRLRSRSNVVEGGRPLASPVCVCSVWESCERTDVAVALCRGHGRLVLNGRTSGGVR